MSDEGEIFFPAALHFQGSLGGVGLDGEPDRLVEDPIYNVERLSLQTYAVLVREIVNAAAENVVLGDDFLQIESFLEPLQTMRGRTASFQGLRNCRARLGFKRVRQFVQKVGDVVVKCGRIEVLSRGELLDLLPPLDKQGRALLADEPRQVVQVIANLLLCSRAAVAQAVSARIAPERNRGWCAVEGSRYR